MERWQSSVTLRTQNTSADIIAAEKRLRQWRTAAAFFAAAFLALSLWISFHWVKANEQDLGITRVDPSAPEARRIKELIRPLRYNFIPRLLTPNVRLALDAQNRRWYLLNIRSYDENGSIQLTEGRYGVCGDLAAYTLEHIRAWLGERYRIEYVRVDESNYFFAPESTHYALKINDLQDPQKKTYLLDPSFRRYGPIEQFDDYLFRQNIQRIKLLEEKATYDVFAAGEFTPVLIRKDYMLGLVMRPANNRWDSENHEVAILSALKHRYNAHYILALRKTNGKHEYFEDTERALRVMSKADYGHLRRRIIELFENMTYDIPVEPSVPKTFTTRSLWNMRPEEIQERLSTINQGH